MVTAMNYTEEVLAKVPRRTPTSSETVHTKGIIEDYPPVKEVFPLKSIQVTHGCMQCGLPTRFTVYSPTHDSNEFYPEFLRKTGLAPGISLQLVPL